MRFFRIGVFFLCGALLFCAALPAAAAVRVTGVTLEPSALSIEKGETYRLRVTVHPANATNKAVTWWTTDASVAPVRAADGMVGGLSEGTATITVRTEDGHFTATSDVTVTDKGFGCSVGGGAGAWALTLLVPLALLKRRKK